MQVWARRAQINRVIGLIQDGGSLLAAARGAAGSSPIRGRSVAYVLPQAGGRSWLVRELRHGGMLRRLTRGLFCRLWGNRPLNELEVAGALERFGIRTPPVIAAVIYRRGLLYRGEVAREFVAARGDLADLLCSDTAGEEEWREACAAAGDLVGRLHLAGVLHPDLNLRNVLIVPREGGYGSEAWILDLEKCRIGPGLRQAVRKRMLRRMRHSARRLEKARGRPFPPLLWAAFERAYAEVIHAD
jgi:hypothetical protein